MEVHHPAACWEWTGACSERGYGLVTSFLRSGLGKFYAHRVAYTILIGEPDSTHHLDHLCRNPKCVNPDHIQAVPPKVNILRGVGIGKRNSLRTHCAQGHELTPDNLTGDKSRRRCKICNDRVQSATRTLKFQVFTCEICGSTFSPHKPDQHTCSDKCRNKRTHLIRVQRRAANANG